MPVEPYILELRKKDQTTVRVLVHSAALPKMEETGLPETFGILVEQSPVPQSRVVRDPEGQGRTPYEEATKH